MDVLDLLDEADKRATYAPWLVERDGDYSTVRYDYGSDDNEDNTIEVFQKYFLDFQKRDESDLELAVLMRNNIRALIDVAKAARDLRSDIARTVDLSLDWSYKVDESHPERMEAISTIVDSNHLMAFVNALQQLDGGGDE